MAPDCCLVASRSLREYRGEFEAVLVSVGVCAQFVRAPGWWREVVRMVAVASDAVLIQVWPVSLAWLGLVGSSLGLIRWVVKS